VPAPSSRLRSLALAAAFCALTTVIALPLRDGLEPANIVMLFLLTVLIIAVRLGREPAVLAAFLSVALFDFFFVPPHLTFSVADAQYLVTFAVMLAVGLIASHLTARLAESTEEAQARERETRALYELARDLGAAMTVEQVTAILERFLGMLSMRVGLLIDEALPARGEFVVHGAYHPTEADLVKARAAYERNHIVEPGFLAGTAATFVPFSGTTRVRGVLAVVPRTETKGFIRARLPLLEAVASLVGIAVERIHYADIARQSELAAQTAQLRSSILSSISHDLRTPLTSLVGLADSLADQQTALPAEARETAGIIRDQAQAMHRMVANLLEMARLQSGAVALDKQWQPFDDIVGSSVRLIDDLLAQRQLEIDLPADLPLIYFDAVLMERVLCNLLENAAKYSEPAALIRIAGRIEGEMFAVTVCNTGAGFPATSLDRIFDLFVRGNQESAVPGTGIGLAVCRAIVTAHGGAIVAENRPGQACIRFTLPLGTPPGLEEDLP
jgi:two-component system sensor histidine kinase KdpD